MAFQKRIVLIKAKNVLRPSDDGPAARGMKGVEMEEAKVEEKRKG